MRRTVFGLILALGATPLAAQIYNIDPSHSEVGFEVVHMSISHVRGDFAKFSGSVDINEKDITLSQVSLNVDASSVDTRVGMRDDDLRSSNFFDVTNTPGILFKSTKIVKTADGYDLTGDLTIHGVTKPVTLKATLTDAVDLGKMGVKRGFSLRGSVDRLDYGLAPKAPNAMISDKVDLIVDGELAKAKDDAPKN
jgi:polyisoprenoid-binding protein YceI